MKKIVVAAFKTAALWFFGIMLGLFLFSTLTVLVGVGDAALAALVIVVGGAIILGRRKKKNVADKFGDVARGSEVQDHTDK